MSSLHQRIADLSSDRLALLVQRVRERKGVGPESEIPRRPHGLEPAPLSFAQQRMWFLDQLEPGGPVYNIAAAVDIRGALDAALLARALGEVARRHEILRSLFWSPSGLPVQQAVPDASLALPVIDLAGLPAAARGPEEERLARATARHGFDLASRPPVVARLLRREEREHVLLLVLHHIAADGWSTGVLVREVAALYEAGIRGEAVRLPEPALQYADYAVWQRQRLQGELLDGSLEWWRGQLAGAPALALPADRPGAARDSRGARQPLTVPAGSAQALRQLCQREGVTLFAALLALLDALLCRTTGQEDIAVGTPVANRTHPQTEGLIGFFANTLVLRTRMDAEAPFRALLARAGAVVAEAFQHQEAPFEKLVEELEPERAQGRNPLFQVMLAFQAAPLRCELPGCALEVRYLETGTAKLDLLLSLTEHGGALRGSFEHSLALFDPATVARLSRSFLRLLEGACAEPERRVSELVLLDEAERHQLLVEWNDTRAEAPVESTVHALFERQALRTPGAPAVVWDGSELTYAELDAQADALARQLRGLGVGPESLVGICLERSPRLLVALLGVLKAGGAYVPLDPSYPPERLAFLLEDSGARLALTQTGLEDRLPVTVHRVLLDGALRKAAAGHADTGSPSSGGSLAYVIYTSGSTGRPKGVAIEHCSAAAFLTWVRRTFTAEEMSGVLAATSICFDLSIFELFGPLTCGGTVILAADALSLPGLPAADRVRLLNTVPSAAAELARCDGLPESLCTINLAGEPLPGSLVRRLTAGRSARVLNLYGPSEDTTYSTWCRVEPEAGEPTIGRPLADTRVYLLDSRLQPVPLGVRGEICLGSASLARGYLGRPELTAERFVPDPFGSAPGARLYQTGDLARLLSGGEIDFLGRLDHQVKIRGFRIEPGEIETALLALPGVREAVVIPEERAGQKRLAAYVALEGETPVSALRAGLASRLPAHLVPSRIVRLEALPRTPNGKIDRRALPALSGLDEPEAGTHEAPRTPTEELLAAIWEELLGVERIGAADSFFERGGHSLLALQALARVRDAFGVELPVRALFDEPTLAGLAGRIEAARREEQGVRVPQIRPVLRTGDLPLSFAQERLWFLARLQPELDAAYNVPLALRLEGDVDPRLVAASLRRLVSRHEALRATFAEVGGRPVQVVAPALDVPLPVIDLGGLPAAGRQAEVARLVRSEAARPFDLGRGPLLRSSWLALGPGEQVLLLTLHHIVSDGWSLGVLAGELSAGYAALAQGAEPTLPPLPLQPADHAAWQRQWLTGEPLERLLGYWRPRLSGAPRLRLEIGRPPAAPPGAGARRSDALPLGLPERLARLGRERSATLFMTLLAAFQALLGRVTGQEDLPVGTPVASREPGATSGLIGLFVNTLVLRTSLAGDPSFTELVRRVREVSLGAYEHREMPFEKLAEELVPERSAGSSPLFQAMFVLQTAPLPPLRLGAARSSLLDVDPGVARLDLTLALAEVEGVWQASWEHRRSVLDAAAVARLSRSFLRLLEGACAEPERQVSELVLLDEAERHQLLVEWNDTRAEAPAESTVHGLFERQALRTPGAPAVVWDGSELTYAELDAQADALARQLRGLGVGPESLVGICLERSPRLLVALLGVLKAGGAYVPLDPSYPPERLAFLLEDSGARLALTQIGLEDRLPVTVHRVLLDGALRKAAAGHADTGSPSSGGSLAYVIYTSGSTGRPKGVAIEHRSSAAFLTWVGRTFTAEEMSGVLAATSICFDLSIFELFGPLACGGTVILAADALSLPGLPAADRVRLLNTVPSAAAELARCGGLPESLRTINLAGEPLPGSLVRRLTAGRSARVLNLYGPSEDTTYSTWCRVEPEAGEPTIGRPLADTRVYLLDSRLEPVPLGVRGEICLGSASLARGYLGRPELTAERFVPDPFGGEPGARLYRTGDLARLLPGGAIDFLGRLDHQVKIRGYRIEPGEIETALLALPGVREAVVIPEERAGQKRLAAYVALEGETPVSALRAGLASRLPAHLVPSRIVRLEALPRTPNGKIDRQALPALADLDEPEPGPCEAPRTPTEELLAAIWEELLGAERIGVGESFFERGGHSLLAVQALARVRDAFGVELPVRALFDEPTLGGLAGSIEAARREERGGRVPPVRPVPRTGDLPLSFAQERLWFLARLQPELGPAYNLPFAVRLRGELDAAVLARSLREIVRRHEILRTTFAEVDGVPVQRVAPAPDAEPDCPVFDLRPLEPGARETEARRRIAEEAATPFDLGGGPLLRAQLLRLGDAEHLLVVDLHHIVADGWSTVVLTRELAELYRAFRAGEAAPLPPLPIQYADFTVWQRQVVSGEAAAAQLRYWTEVLAGAPEGHDLPTDRPRPAAPRSRGGRESLVLDAGLASRLRTLGRKQGATLFMTLLAALQLLLQRLAGQDDIVVGSPIGSRGRTETEGLIGIFLNQLALRTDLAGDPSFRELLARVRRTALGAYAHSDLPFERVLEALPIRRDLSRTPLFQVMLNTLSFPRRDLQIPGLTLEVPEPPEVPAKLDLTLYVVEEGERVRCELVYDADLFDGATAAGLLAQLAAVLGQASADPEAPIGSFSLVTEAARAVLPDPLRPLDATWEGSVPEVFSRRVQENPGAVAIAEPGGAWTYAEVESLAWRVAGCLLDAGVRPGDRVALYGHRSASLVWSVLGVLASGAAFVILDPSYPELRLAEALRFVQPRATLLLAAAGPVPAAVAACLAESGCPALAIPAGREAALERLARFAERAPAVEIGPDSPAYVALTSGSTGLPKGVLGRHGSLTHFTPWQRQEFGFGPADRFSMLSGLAHDPLHRDMFQPLQVGGTICIPDPERIGTPGYLANWLAGAGVTVAHLTPAMAQMIAEGGEDVRIPALRLAFFVGEALTRRDVESMRRLAPGLTVVNYFGSTETQRAVGFYRVPGRLPEREVLPLGRGIRDVHLLVLTAAGHLAGIGESGELAVRSPHIALGYLGDPERTRQRFQANPRTGDPADRIYRTGDLGRYLPDGNAVFLGRSDRQVKIRGFRVELEEIEAALGQHPRVRDAAVVLWDGEGRDDRLLTAYLVADGACPSLREVRELLGARLPDYMLPAAVVPLPALPLTPNRKLDRAALPRPEHRAASGEAAAGTPVEEILAGIWADLLGLERVAAGDDFFHLGGHSLLAARLAARVRTAFGVELPLRAVFERPALAALAAEIGERRDAAGPRRPPIVHYPRQRAPLSYAQLRLWFLDQLQPGTAAFNLPVALHLDGPLATTALAQALADVVRRQGALRTTFAVENGHPMQVVSPEAAVGLPLVDLTALPGADRRAAVARELAHEIARLPFDLARGPLMRAALLRLGAREHLAVLSLHHIVTDGWSSGILAREISSLYAAHAAGVDPGLSAPPVQYTDFAAWQRQWLRGEVFDAQLDWWRDQLRGAPALSDLPADQPRPQVLSSRGATRSFFVPEEVAAALRGLCRQDGATLFMVLLAGFQVLVHRLTGREDMLLGTDVASRDQTELEGVIGFFVNQLVLRGDLAGNPGFRAILRRVRATALSAYAHQDVPFERVVDASGAVRSLGASPLFQIKLVVQNAPFEARGLAGLDLTPVELEKGTSQQDLVLTFREADGGLRGWINYSTDLFRPATIERWVDLYTVILRRAAERPDAPLAEFEHLADSERRQRTMEMQGRPQLGFKDFQAARPRPLEVAPQALVTQSFLAPGQTLPLVIQPAVAGVDLVDWARGERDAIERDLLRYGAILFRGFEIEEPERFEQLASAVCSNLFDDNGEHPHDTVSGNVYTPVFYAPSRKLLWHNENSFNLRWPRKILFCCVRPADEGGETPIADSREVFARIPAEIRDRFQENGVAYQRNYADGLGLTWQEVFRTSDRQGVEQYCADNELDWQWRDGDRLRTLGIRPAAIRHPLTGEMSWFNQAQHWHVSCLDPATRESMSFLFSEEELPRNCYLGDGRRIPDADMRAILGVYEQVEVAFRWQKGDVLMLDNILTAHARNAFQGPRKLLVAMGDMMSFGEIEA